MKMWMLAGAASLMLAGMAHAVQDSEPAATLKVGDKAPPLDQVTWVQGEPVTAFEAGKVYVIDFWATWCPPCRESIPHINSLAKQYASDVTVIGAAVWPRPKMVPTKDFVAQKGDGMSYRIAEDIDGHIAKTWMQAAGQNGIPTAMVIDQKGTIAWIGHPMDGLDYVMDHVAKEGRFDAKGLDEYRAAKQKEDEAQQAKAAELKSKIAGARDAKDWNQCADLQDQLYLLDPVGNGQSAIWSYTYRVLAGDKDGAARYGNKLASETFKDDANSLNAFAWAIVDPEWPATAEQRDLDLALLSAQRADELTKDSDPNVLDTVARVHFLKGNVAEAVRLQKTALELATNDKLKADLQTRLDEYTKAQAHG